MMQLVYDYMLDVKQRFVIFYVDLCTAYIRALTNAQSSPLILSLENDKFETNTQQRVECDLQFMSYVTLRKHLTSGYHVSGFKPDFM